MGLLNLFGGDDSSSASSTVQTTTTQNVANFATNGGVANSASVNGSGNWIQNNTETLSDDVAIRAMDNMLTMGQDALLFGSDTQKRAFGFAEDTQKQALQFAQQSNQDTLNFASKQIAQSNTQAVAATGNAQQAYQAALSYGATQTGKAIDSLTKSSEQLDKAYADAKGVLSQNTIMVAIAGGVAVMFFALKARHA